MSLEEIFRSFRTRRWWSIRQLYLVLFIIQINNASKVTYLYPYLKVLNPEVSDVFYSWVIGVFPIGIVLSSPIFGFWYNRVSTRQPICFNLMLLTLCNLLYSCCNLFPPNLAIWMILISRFLMGISASSKAVINSYITSATTLQERSVILSNLFQTIPISFVLGPIIGLLCQPLGYPGYIIPYINVSFNLYTAPSFIIALLAFINFVLMFWFKEFIVNPLTSRKKCNNCYAKSQEFDPLLSSETSIEEIHTNNKLPNAPYDKLPLFSLGISTFVSHLLVAITDALISPYSMDEFAWTKEQAISYNNIILIISGVASYVGIIFMKRMLKCMSERMVYLIAFLVLSLSFFIYIPWPGSIPEPIHQMGYNHSLEIVGCDYFRQSWCLTVPKLNVVQFFLAPVIFFLAFPIIYAITIILASKIIGPHPPGLILGIIGSSASLGRGLGPLILVPLYFRYGPQVTYASMDGIVIAIILLTLLTYNRLVPYGSPRKYFEYFFK
ncbi:Major facilitator superfamily domain-containing protein 8-like [Oopsacas minuta]|uniref:Major facilitator superfamily domain-containing protein 8-like n=1 Tax=Oopsacas minuta TaxID=111878 RepID=A0AAV7K8E3_9METZ|nr:Major facilitator superfamily domain-containing protein 8-like [Oopsacas minuta]